MTKHYLPNGDELRVWSFYKVRKGKKIFIHWIGKNSEGRDSVVGVIEGSILPLQWFIDGKRFKNELSDCDIISLWKEESKIDVTEEIIDIARKIYYHHGGDEAESWEAALEAVFTHIASNSRKLNNSIFDSFSPENPILDEQKQGEWINHNGNDTPKNIIKSNFVDIKFLGGRELLHVSPFNYQWENWILPEEKGHEHIIAYRIIPEQTEPKKQTLLQYFYPPLDTVEIKEYKLISKISEYIELHLEQSK